MTFDAAITLGVLVATALVLVLDRFPPIVVLGAAVVALLFADVIDTEVALSGFSSPAPATIGALYVVAGAATVTGTFASLVDRLLDRRRPLFSLVACTAMISSVVPNTPLVAMFAPRVVRWCQRRGVSESRFLMPLSFASLLGGVITMIGTSTNLVVSDLIVQAGQEPLGVFDITIVGLPVAAAGVLVLSTIGARLLPDRSPGATDLTRQAREFQMAARIDAEGPLVGRTIAESGLRALDGVFLAMVDRHGADQSRSTALAAAPDTVLQAGDVCCFVGDVGRVLDLHDVAGLTSLERAHLLDAVGPGTDVFEAVVSPSSRLLGSSLRDTEFRSRYSGAVIAIHRADGQLSGQLGRIPLRAGDVLLVLAGSSFARQWRGHADFSLVAAVDGASPVRRPRSWLVLLAALGMILVAALRFTSLFEAALGAAIVVVAGGALTTQEAWRAVNVNVVLTMAVAISLGGAVAASGLAGDIALLVGEVDRLGLGNVGLVVTVMLATIVLTELLTNTAAAALMIPVGLSIAVNLDLDPRLMAVSVLIGASCSFLTPIGYQTNLMVFSLGGYRFSDFARVGAPLTLSTLVVGATLIPLVYG
ncbi:MAG: SLC13 family permease [Ilumatobacteraceae bacterium]